MASDLIPGTLATVPHCATARARLSSCRAAACPQHLAQLGSGAARLPASRCSACGRNGPWSDSPFVRTVEGARCRGCSVVTIGASRSIVPNLNRFTAFGAHAAGVAGQIVSAGGAEAQAYPPPLSQFHRCPAERRQSKCDGRRIERHHRNCQRACAPRSCRRRI